MTFFVTVKGTKGVQPSGTVTIKSGSTTLCSTSSFYELISGTIIALCSLSNSQLTAGSYSVTAVYSGDSHYAGSTSGVERFLVTNSRRSEVREGQRAVVGFIRFDGDTLIRLGEEFRYL
jgi:hypothetical protein